MTPARIRILIVDDHTLFRESLGRLLEAEPDFEIVGSCGSVADAIQCLTTTTVDLVLLDYDLGLDRGTSFLTRARELAYQGKVLVLTAGVGQLEAAEMIRLGIAGVIRKHSSLAALTQSIRDVHQGKEAFEPGYFRSILAKTAALPSDPSAKTLSERERQVLRYVFEGLANKEIAARLQMSESSVKAVLQQLFAKTGVRTRSQLVRAALEIYHDQL